MKKFRLLTAEEIECRVQTVNDKGCSLLLYKTARTDADLLDETVGAEHWQNDFKEIGGVLYCGIGIHYHELGDWIWKRDAGTESNTEAEKGRASDAFKRAGFKWGIGRELYSSPRIWIYPDAVKLKEKNGKWLTYDTFSVSSITYDNANRINSLTIVNDTSGEIAYQFPKQNAKPTRKPEPVKAPDDAENLPFLCEVCHRQITDYTFEKGTKDAAWIGKYSRTTYGKQLCGMHLAIAIEEDKKNASK